MIKVPRVLVEPSDYLIRNAGDTAMMQVGLKRLSDLLPGAHIQVFSDEPEAFPFTTHNLEAVTTEGRHYWFQSPWNVERVLRLGRVGSYARAYLRRNYPNLSLALMHRFNGATGCELRAIDEFFEMVCAADLLVVTGMGGITDAFPGYAQQLLEVVRMAQKAGARTAMLGQGLGPLKDRKLRRLASDTLPHLDILALREGSASLHLAQELGVPRDCIEVTGDDAIELALSNDSPLLGRGLGVNVRAANYSEVNDLDIQRLRPILQDAARRLRTQLVPVPISWEGDVATLGRLLAGSISTCDAGATLETPSGVVAQVRQCRVLVTGSYHAGVFALANGIPTLGLVRADYYRDKFRGLAGMFPSGCVIVDLDDPRLEEHLESAIMQAWASAEELGTVLRSAAQQQLERSRAVYAKLPALVQ